jgi:hypothetical protein
MHLSSRIIICILFNERIMMAITREDDFVSRAAGEWRNSSERVIAIIREVFFFSILSSIKVTLAHI